MQAEDKLRRLAILTSFVPTGHRQFDWRAIEAELGLPLPVEYRLYVESFPPGTHREWLTVNHPGELGGTSRLVKGFRPFPDPPSVGGNETPFRFYPTAGGLVPWAVFDNDTMLCWLPDASDPNRWPVIAHNIANEYEPIPGSTLDALTGVVRGDFGHNVFPEYFFTCSLSFILLDRACTEGY